VLIRVRIDICKTLIYNLIERFNVYHIDHSIGNLILYLIH